MARVTVEDCLKYVDSNYDLVLRAAKRARAIAEGAEPLVERDNDKPTVLALREIAENVTVKEPEESSVIEPLLFTERPQIEIDIEA